MPSTSQIIYIETEVLVYLADVSNQEEAKKCIPTIVRKLERDLDYFNQYSQRKAHKGDRLSLGDWSFVALLYREIIHL